MSSVKLVAEIGINHNGNMAYVKKMIEIAADAGFDYVKFQKRNVEKTTPTNKWDVPKDTPWGTLKYIDYKRKLEEVDYDMVEILCGENKIGWFGSPWDVDSVEYLASYMPEYIKVASALVTDYDVLQAIKETHIPVIISTGMSSKEEIEKALLILEPNQVKYILACTATYPSANEEMNLSFIQTLAKQYPYHKIGFSNHHPGVFFAAASVMYGAEMVEVHVTLDRSMFGSDQAASLEPEGQFKLCKYVRDLQVAIGNGDWVVWDSEEPVKRNLRWKDYK